MPITPTPENTPLPGGGSWRWSAEAACWVDAAVAVSPSDSAVLLQDPMPPAAVDVATPTKSSKSKE